MDLTPATLDGKYVRLVPLSLDHLDALWEVARDPVLWKWTTNVIHSREELHKYLEQGLEWVDNGTAIPFTILVKQPNSNTPRVIGSTRFANIDQGFRRVEIGWTWIGKQWQRTGANTEMKYLMLRHAFETLRCMRVELKTDALNAQSRAAILRIGAKEEGTFRSHMITQAGRIRDTVYFSIIDSEWPGVKKSLEEKMQQWNTR